MINVQTTILARKKAGHGLSAGYVASGMLQGIEPGTLVVTAAFASVTHGRDVSPLRVLAFALFGYGVGTTANVAHYLFSAVEAAELPVMENPTRPVKAGLFFAHLEAANAVWRERETHAANVAKASATRRDGATIARESAFHAALLGRSGFDNAVRLAGRNTDHWNTVRKSLRDSGFITL